MTIPAPLPAAHATLSQEMFDAAGELASRIELGEFDDLDEGQMSDLRALSEAMEQWAAKASTMEERLLLMPGDPSWYPRGRTVAIRN